MHQACFHCRRGHTARRIVATIEDWALKCGCWKNKIRSFNICCVVRSAPGAIHYFGCSFVGNHWECTVIKKNVCNNFCDRQWAALTWQWLGFTAKPLADAPLYCPLALCVSQAAGVACSSKYWNSSGLFGTVGSSSWLTGLSQSCTSSVWGNCGVWAECCAF